MRAVFMHLFMLCMCVALIRVGVSILQYMCLYRCECTCVHVCVRDQWSLEYAEYNSSSVLRHAMYLHMYVRAKDGSIQLLSVVLLQDQFTWHAATVNYTVESVSFITPKNTNECLHSVYCFNYLVNSLAPRSSNPIIDCSVVSDQR